MVRFQTRRSLRFLLEFEEVITMRLDKYLKVSRIIKRRTVAKEAGEGGRVSINGKVTRPWR